MKSSRKEKSSGLPSLDEFSKSSSKNPSQKKPIDRFKYICVFCPKMTFLSQHNIFNHITLKCEGPKHGSEIQDCRKIYHCALCGVLKNVTLHRLMQHMVEFHQEELELKQQCSKCFEFYDKMSVYELYYGMMLPSGNDAALVLAENFGRFFWNYWNK